MNRKENVKKVIVWDEGSRKIHLCMKVHTKNKKTGTPFWGFFFLGIIRLIKFEREGDNIE